MSAYLARRFWQIAATMQSEALAPHDLARWHTALLAQIHDTPGQDRNCLAAAIGIDATSTGQALAAFKALRAGDTLVVWKLDRLGRNLSQLLQTAERLDAKGCKLLVVTEAIDTTTPMGRFMFNVMGSFAPLEREMIQERTRAGLAAARERGRVGDRKRTITAEVAEAGRRMVADIAEGGEGLTVTAAAARLKISRSALYKAMQELANDRGASDLED